MASVTSAPGVPDIIRQKLRAMRTRLTGWIIVDGVAWLLIIALVLAFFDMLVDRLFKMDFSQRVIMLCLMACGLLAVAFYRIVRPLTKLPSDDALILEVEDKNSELKESLISSVQLSRTGEIEAKGMSISLWQATIQQGIEKARAVNFGSALNGTRSAINWVLLLVAVVGMIGIGFGISQDGFLKTWFNRNILLLDDQWPQNTYLQFVHPRDGSVVEDDEMVFARGDDVKQIVRVDRERSKVTKVDVTLEIDDGRKRSKIKMRNSGRKSDMDHMAIFRNVSDEFRMRAIGGDDVTRWIQVRLVEAPTVVKLDMTANLPKYVGNDGKLKLEGSGPHSILKGSTVDLVATVNKPLSKAAIKLGEKRFDLKPTDDKLVYQLTLPGEGELQGGKYEFELADLAGQTSNRPINFSLKIGEDKPPVVRASLQGISGLVVPRAFLPISFSATDQYGLTRTAFYYSYKGQENSVPVEKIIDVPMEKENPSHKTVRQVAILDLRPEKIPVGVTLRVNVYAWDNRPGNPEPGKSREFLLRVVSEEELRADLLRREIEQRNAFEQAYNNQMELQTELRALAASKPSKDDDPARQQEIIDQFVTERENKVLELQRRQKIVGTNITAIADRFAAFLIEAENNRLDESEKGLDQTAGLRTYKDRVAKDIIQPIRLLDENEIIAAVQGIDICRRLTRKPEFVTQTDKTSEIQETILEKMRLILKAMEDAESYQQVVNDLVEIKVKQEGIGKGVEDEKNKPGELDDIFDNDGESDKSGKNKKDKK